MDDITVHETSDICSECNMPLGNDPDNLISADVLIVVDFEEIKIPMVWHQVCTPEFIRISNG